MNQTLIEFRQLYDICQRNEIFDVHKELTEYERELDDLNRIKEKFNKEEVPLRVVVIGDYSTGKSSFINSLLGSKILPTGDLPITGVITEIKYGDNSMAYINFKNGKQKGLTLDKFKDLTLQNRNIQIDIQDLDVCELFYPSPILRMIEIIDTPGFGNIEDSREAEHTRLTHKAIKESDAFIFVFNVDKGITASEFEQIEKIKNEKRIIAVLNQMDLKPQYKHQELLNFYKEKFKEKCEVVLPYSAKMVMETLIYDDIKKVFQEDIPNLIINEENLEIKVKKESDGYSIQIIGKEIEKPEDFIKNNNKEIWRKEIKAKTENKTADYYFKLRDEALQTFKKLQEDARILKSRILQEKNKELTKKNEEIMKNLIQMLSSQENRYEKLINEIEEKRYEIIKTMNKVVRENLKTFKSNDELKFKKMCSQFKLKISELLVFLSSFFKSKLDSLEQDINFLKKYLNLGGEL